MVCAAGGVSVAGEVAGRAGGHDGVSCRVHETPVVSWLPGSGSVHAQG
jgi:hypothetical protein